MSHLIRSATATARTAAPARLRQLSNHLGLRATTPITTVHPSLLHRRTMSLPATMKGISIAKTGGTEVLEYKTDLPVPTPKAGEVLVKNDFIGVNYIDTYFRTGLYPPPHLPYTLGREGGGTVVQVGSGGSIDASLKEGAAVAYLAQGSYAEYTAVPAMHAYALPAGVDTRTGAAALLQGLTAVTMIEDAHKVKAGDWVLVHAAAGGMGLWLCQTLRAVGAHVIGTASTAEKRELARQAGAEVLLEYPAQHAGGADGFVAHVKELTGGAGCIAVLDGVGASTFDVSLECIARKGTLVSFGNASGAPAPLSIARLSAKNTRLMRPTLFNFIATRDEFAPFARTMFDMVAAGKVTVKVHEVYPLSETARAHQDLEGRVTTGKLLLKP